MKKLETKEVNLAFELAEKLNDKCSIAQFLNMCRKYKERFLKEILEEVLKTPLRKIRKSRGALFTYLVRMYGNKDNFRS
jgi:hypothetical protein